MLLNPGSELTIILLYVDLVAYDNDAAHIKQQIQAQYE